jgi:hypothetical protein
MSSPNNNNNNNNNTQLGSGFFNNPNAAANTSIVPMQVVDRPRRSITPPTPPLAQRQRRSSFPADVEPLESFNQQMLLSGQSSPDNNLVEFKYAEPAETEYRVTFPQTPPNNPYSGGNLIPFAQFPSTTTPPPTMGISGMSNLNAPPLMLPPPSPNIPVSPYDRSNTGRPSGLTVQVPPALPANVQQGFGQQQQQQPFGQQEQFGQLPYFEQKQQQQQQQQQPFNGFFATTNPSAGTINNNNNFTNASLPSQSQSHELISDYLSRALQSATNLYNEDYAYIDSDISTGEALQEALQVVTNLTTQNQQLQTSQQTLLSDVYNRWQYLFDRQSRGNWIDANDQINEDYFHALSAILMSDESELEIPFRQQQQNVAGTNQQRNALSIIQLMQDLSTLIEGRDANAMQNAYGRIDGRLNGTYKALSGLLQTQLNSEQHRLRDPALVRQIVSAVASQEVASNPLWRATRGNGAPLEFKFTLSGPYQQATSTIARLTSVIGQLRQQYQSITNNNNNNNNNNFSNNARLAQLVAVSIARFEEELRRVQLRQNLIDNLTLNAPRLVNLLTLRFTPPSNQQQQRQQQQQS